MNYLTKITLNYRVPTVADALALRDTLSKEPNSELTSFTYTTKYQKSTDEEYQLVKVSLLINDEKEPVNAVNFSLGCDE